MIREPLVVNQIIADIEVVRLRIWLGIFAYSAFEIKYGPTKNRLIPRI